MIALTAILIIIAFTLFNRIRGGGLGADRLPGHPRYYVAPVIFGLAWWWLGDWQRAAWFSGVWLAWSLQAWGDIYMLGRQRMDGKPVRDFWTCITGLFTLGLRAFSEGKNDLHRSKQR